LGRFTTLRSWLSQWSYDESRAHGVKNGAGVSCPTLTITNSADLACTPSHARRLFDGLASSDKSFVEIQGADHYYMARPDLLPTAVAQVTGWLDERGF
jgi:alpha-beta hydrolase superfamily lysophospholipase